MKFIVENSNSNYKDKIVKIIENHKKEIFDFFGKSIDELPFNIYIYDSIENLILGLKERGFNKNPDYMCACHKDEDNSLNFFEPKDNSSENEWSKDEYDNVIFHELIHGIQFTLFGSNYEWFNEGIAKYLDYTYKNGMNYLLKNYINNNKIPPQEEIEYEFGMHNYDSYDYAYIMVRYLIETMDKFEFIELVKDQNKIDRIKNGLLIRAIEYYNEKFVAEEKEALI